MKRNIFSLFCILLAGLVLFASCSSATSQTPSAPGEATIEDHNDVEIQNTDIAKPELTLISEENGTYTYEDAEGNKTTLTIACTEGNGTVRVEDSTIFIESVTEDTVFELSGTFYGNILAEVDEDAKLELSLCGLTLYSYDEAPIVVNGGDKVTISAKKETENAVFDLREAVGEDDISAAIYATSDLDLQGKGTLYVTSESNNGIHTKDDLKVKNLTLQVDCRDNALKGNDSVTIESGTITLIARSGDGIKTKNSDLSSKGKQRGSVTILDGDILIYAASDGIDAAYNVEIEETASLNLQIFTERYSSYSEGVSATSGDQKQLEALPDGAQVPDFGTLPSEPPEGFSEELPEGFSGGQPTGNENFSGKTRPGGFGQKGSGNAPGGFSGGFQGGTNPFGGGMGWNEGNSDKSEGSAKGIKADNEVIIKGGNITISSYDDAIHANNDEELETGDVPFGNVTISGGTIQIATSDDGVHADGTLTISGGKLSITKCYEGLEGNIVEISGGDISVIASDDGVNAKAASGTGITISGGKLYVYAGGDGLDANSKTQYEAILFSGGEVVVISTGNADSSIDSEKGYRYTGGKVIAIGRSGGMGSEALKCENFSSIGTSKTISLQEGSYLTVSGVGTVRLPTSINALVVVLGESHATIASSSSTDETLDDNGVAWDHK